MRCSHVLVGLWLVGLAAACSAESGGPAGAELPTGSERGPCYGNGTCDASLVCASGTCVNVSGTGSSSGGQASSVNGASTSGAPSSGNASSTSTPGSSSSLPANSSAGAVSSTSVPELSSSSLASSSSMMANPSSSAGASSAACVPETDQGYCMRLGKDCATVVGFDNCGASRATLCGACSLPETCGAIEDNVCACAPETDAEFCSRGGFSCGTVTTNDNCGTPRTTTCGPVCACVPEPEEQVCARHGLSCSAVWDQDNCGTWRNLLCRNGCEAGVCQVLGTGSNCSGGPQAPDFLNNCLNGLCVPARMWCAYNPSSGTWNFQAPGVGGSGADNCSCTSSTHIAARFNTLPGANTDQDCTQCVELPGSRVVCF